MTKETLDGTTKRAKDAKYARPWDDVFYALPVLALGGAGLVIGFNWGWELVESGNDPASLLGVFLWPLRWAALIGYTVGGLVLGVLLGALPYAMYRLFGLRRESSRAEDRTRAALESAMNDVVSRTDFAEP